MRFILLYRAWTFPYRVHRNALKDTLHYGYSKNCFQNLKCDNFRSTGNHLRQAQYSFKSKKLRCIQLAGYFGTKCLRFPWLAVHIRTCPLIVVNGCYSETGRIRFRRVWFQTPNSVIFLPSWSSKERTQ